MGKDPAIVEEHFEFAIDGIGTIDIVWQRFRECAQNAFEQGEISIFCRSRKV